MKRREILARALVWMGILLWFGCCALFERYSYTRPTVERRAEGRVYVQNNHGYHTYLTAQEHFLLIFLGMAAGVLFLAGSLVDPERRMWRWRALR